MGDDVEVTTPKKPLVSVTITTYNSEVTIEAVLESLLVQDYPLKAIEVIVVEGHSIDNTLNILERFRKDYRDNFHDFKVVLHERNLGVSKARNDGIKLSKGKYIVILDSDVILPHNAISEMINYMESHPKIGFCKLNLKDDTANPIMKWQYEVRSGRISKTFSCADASMVRREVLEKSGLYNESMGPPFSVDEDLEFGARIHKASYKGVILGSIVAHHLTEKRDTHLQSIKNANIAKKHTITLSTQLRWLLGYLHTRQGWSWYMFLTSLPLGSRIRYLFHSVFLPCLILLFVSMLQPLILACSVITSLSIIVFLDVLRDFFNSRKIHKSLVLAFLSCINRSLRGIGALLYLIKYACIGSAESSAQNA